ncbi:MAG: acyltransferase [Lachnospiraceae bacterium]|jgi:hypothetical protein|nr:acyltransferase [Lachnospiraceae bacterium]
MAGKALTEKGQGMTKEQSARLQGVAVLLLLYHHFFNDLSIYGERLSFWRPEWVLHFAWFGKICVGMFAFVTGYGMCKALEKRNGAAITRCLRQMLQLLIRYWVVFLLFMGCMFSMGRRQFELTEFLENFFCLKSTYNGAFWYVQQYVIMLLLLAVAEAFLRFAEVICKKGKITEALGKGWLEVTERVVSLLCVLFGMGWGMLAILLPSMRQTLNDFLDIIRIAFVLVCFVGYFCAKLRVFDRLLSRLYALSTIIRILLAVFLLALVGVVRIMLAGSPAYASLDFLFVPIFTIGILLLLQNAKWISARLESLGHLSIYVWLTHLFTFDLTNAILLRYLHNHILFFLVEAILCIFIAYTCCWVERGIRNFSLKKK